MKKILTVAILLFASVLTYACTDKAQAQQKEPEKKEAKSGEVIVMNKDMFIKDVFDYGKSQDWKYTAPIMKELAKEYAGKIVIYKVNVDKERELAALFNASSIPLFVFIPMEGEPQLFRGAADKATYQKAIEDFLLKKK